MKKEEKGLEKSFVFAFFNLFERKKGAVAATATVTSGFFPFFFRFQIGIPERPGATLDGTISVNFAVQVETIKKDAIAVWIFYETFSVADLANKFFFKFIEEEAEEVCQTLDFLVGDPDVAWRSRTASAALLTLKLKSVCVPGKIFFCHFER